MSKFIMFVGLPGAGKSTKALEYEKLGYKIYSPDKIRNELNMHETEQIQEVLDILHSRMKTDLELGNDIIYDSTNLTKQRRRKVLNELKSYNYEKVCYVFIVPLSVCKDRNSKRVGYSKVSDRDYNIMTNCFTIPMSDEGFDKIIYDIQDDKIIVKEE